MTLRKLAASPVMPAFARIAESASELLVGAKCRTAHEAMQIGALRQKRIEPIKVVIDRIDGLILESKFEKSGGVATSHSESDGIFACHWGRSLV